jgi:hypothetical protein
MTSTLPFLPADAYQETPPPPARRRAGLFLGPAGDPAWARPSMWALLLITAVL